jgi:hypothetical protein
MMKDGFFGFCFRKPIQKNSLVRFSIQDLRDITGVIPLPAAMPHSFLVQPEVQR